MTGSLRPRQQEAAIHHPCREGNPPLNRTCIFTAAFLRSAALKMCIRDSHVLPRPDGVNWDGIQYVDADSENEIKGALFVFKPSEQGGKTKTIRLRGLVPTQRLSLIHILTALLFGNARKGQRKLDI